MHVVQRDRMDQDASSGYSKWGSIGWMGLLASRYATGWLESSE